MGLYAENYHRLARLFAPHELPAGRYVSSVDDGLDVHLQVQEHHPYTVELELTYGFVDAHTGQRAPSAQLRMYTDAHVAEALHCHPGRHLWQVLGPFSPVHSVFQYRLRMNRFLADGWNTSPSRGIPPAPWSRSRSRTKAVGNSGSIQSHPWLRPDLCAHGWMHK